MDMYEYIPYHKNRLSVSRVFNEIYFKRYERLRILDILRFYMIFIYTPYVQYSLDFRDMGMYEYLPYHENRLSVSRLFNYIYFKRYRRLKKLDILRFYHIFTHNNEHMMCVKYGKITKC